jgi:hypothetical protein
LEGMGLGYMKNRTDIQIALYRACSVAALLLALGFGGCGGSSGQSGGPSVAAPPKLMDIRGSWDEVASVGTATYPQTLTITSEDFSTGALVGTDFGDQKLFTVVGTISGTDVTFTTTAGSYTGHSTGKVAKSGDTMTMSGTFTDSNNSSGTFTAKRTGPAPSSSA